MSFVFATLQKRNWATALIFLLFLFFYVDAFFVCSLCFNPIFLVIVHGHVPSHHGWFLRDGLYWVFGKIGIDPPQEVPDTLMNEGMIIDWHLLGMANDERNEMDGAAVIF